jgi:hypothetical protein
MKKILCGISAVLQAGKICSNGHHYNRNFAVVAWLSNLVPPSLYFCQIT